MGGWEPDQNPSVHSSYIDHPFFWKFCIPIILLLLLQLYFHASLLFWKPENEFSNSFSQWKALALGNGRKKELMCPCPLASGCTSNNIRAKCNSCSGYVFPALTSRRWLSPLKHRALGSCSSLGSKTLSRALVLVEATSVSAFTFPYYDSIIRNVGPWIFGRLWECSRDILRQPRQLQDLLQFQRQRNYVIRAT